MSAYTPETVDWMKKEMEKLRLGMPRIVPDIRSAVHKEYEIWHYPLVAESLWKADTTLPDSTILWNYYESIKFYI